MSYEISNSLLKVTIAAMGAELQSIQSIDTGLEYLWNGDEKFWPRRSPVLFPIVGGLINDTYSYKGNNYSLSRHGYARDRVFTLTDQKKDSISFELKSDAESLKVYPFHYVLTITYTLKDNQLDCKYNIINKGEETMYCSVGAHPAFNVPLTKDTEFRDWHLHFSETENTDQWPLSPGGLMMPEPVALLKDTQELALTKELFYKDALVFKDLKSTKMSLVSNKSKHGLRMSFDGFPYFGIWAAKNADFVCLEPWCGISDTINDTGEIMNKEGINKLASGDSFSRTWSVEFF